MSSIIDRPASSTPVPSNGQAASRSVHFDATVRRKEKMRQRAAAEPKIAPTEEAAVPAPTAPPRAQIAEPAAPPAANRNGGFVHPAAAAPPPIAAPPVNSNGAAKNNAAAALPSGLELEKFLVEFVVEQTGYPEEMVELDADLEADLGIDSIKKAQLFGELAERFQVDVQGADELSLDDFPTLRHVKSFLDTASAGAPAVERPAPEPAPAVSAQPAATPAPAASEPTTNDAPAPSAAMPQGAELEQFLIAFVVEQTGYPEEMVELDADLEADLGIDSIKKAQLFGELAEQFALDQFQQPNVESAEDLSLDDFPTLRHVMSFLEGTSNAPPAHSTPVPIAASPAPLPTPPMVEPALTLPLDPPAAPASSLQDIDLEKFLIEFVVEQTGYPEEMVELDADLEADLGIDSIKKAQLFGELAELFEVNVEAAEDLSLDDFPTLRHVMEFLEGAPQKATA